MPAKLLSAVVNALAVILLGLVFAIPAFADGGQYGAPVETPSEEPKEVVHETVDAGIGENMIAVAAFLGGASVLFLIISKLTQRVYLLD